MEKNKLKNILTVILARKGSERLKNKNLRKINKKSLAEITIKFSIKLKKYSYILISTDHPKIINIAKKYKIIIPGIRPKYLSGKHSSSLNVVKYIINWYQKNYHTRIKGIIVLQPTSPFRDSNHLIRIIKSYIENGYRYNYVSVSNHQKKKRCNMFIDKKNFLTMPTIKNKANCYTNGNFYILNTKDIKKDTKKTILQSKSKGIIFNSKKLSLDIDTIENLKQARKFANL